MISVVFDINISEKDFLAGAEPVVDRSKPKTYGKTISTARRMFSGTG